MQDNVIDEEQSEEAAAKANTKYISYAYLHATRSEERPHRSRHEQRNILNFPDSSDNKSRGFVEKKK